MLCLEVFAVIQLLLGGGFALRSLIETMQHLRLAYGQLLVALETFLTVNVNLLFLYHDDILGLVHYQVRGLGSLQPVTLLEWLDV